MTKRPAGYLPWYKRKYCIEPKVQLKLVFLLGGIALVSSILICVLAYERIMKLESLYMGYLIGPVFAPETFRAIANSLMLRLIIIVSAMSVVFTLLGVYLTHKLVGPIWKLERELRKVVSGEKIDPIGFRRGDEFRDLPVLINQLVEFYQKNRK
ncbi:MAG: methyl-accepting chemotaxis protein [Oligoflexia bacterium]|nr:methyl-accepting chemotaxis protein [Oligoflexia bacterium]